MQELQLRYHRPYHVIGCIVAALGITVGVWAVLASGLHVFWVLWLILSVSVLIISCYALIDRAVKLKVDPQGIHDLTTLAQRRDIPWREIADIDLSYVRSKSFRNYYLAVALSDGSNIRIWVSGLDMEPEAVAREVRASWDDATGKSQT